MAAAKATATKIVRGGDKNNSNGGCLDDGGGCLDDGGDFLDDDCSNSSGNG